jgi:hypothetical protein
MADASIDAVHSPDHFGYFLFEQTQTFKSKYIGLALSAPPILRYLLDEPVKSAKSAQCDVE